MGGGGAEQMPQLTQYRKRAISSERKVEHKVRSASSSMKDETIRQLFPGEGTKLLSRVEAVPPPPRRSLSGSSRRRWGSAAACTRTPPPLTHHPLLG